MKISEAFDLYKKNYIYLKHQSKRILENQECVKKRLIESAGDINIEDLTVSDVQKFVTDHTNYVARNGSVQQRKINTVRNDLIRIRVVLRYVRMLGVDCLNPEMIPVPKKEETIRPYLTADEVASMIDSAFSLRNKFVISLLYSSGIRLAEMISLNRDSIVNGSFQVVGKGKKARLCFIDKRTEKLMKEYMRRRNDDCNALIISYKNRARMTPTNVQLLVKNSARRAGIDKKVTPHVLRHSFATNFLQNDGNIRYLSAMLGHSSLDTTLVYAHVANNDLKMQYQKYHSV